MIFLSVSSYFVFVLHRVYIMTSFSSSMGSVHWFHSKIVSPCICACLVLCLTLTSLISVNNLPQFGQCTSCSLYSHCVFKCCPSLPFGRVLICIKWTEIKPKFRLDRATFWAMSEVFYISERSTMGWWKTFVAGICKVWNTTYRFILFSVYIFIWYI